MHEAMPEAGTQSFIVRVWCEERDSRSGRFSWRGHVTQVPSGVRRHFSDLDGLALGIAPFLEQMEMDVGRYWRIRVWLRHRRV